MREVAKRPEKDRRELFRFVAQAMRVHEAVIEKDFWVCWVLDYLFQDSPWKSSMIFKGGTSLSKVYGAIERFSEDIDLILDWQLLGYSEDEPWDERSHTQQQIFGEQANRRAAEYLARDIVPVLHQDLSARLGAEIEVSAEGQDVLIRYPGAFSLDALRPEIKLEIGPLAAWAPNDEKSICSYAAERHPSLFKQSHTTVRTIIAERTFWEKATILHQEAHRDSSKILPHRYSRHYYDLYRMNGMPIRDAALKRIDLLDDVVRFKMRFYRCSWAKYEEACPGSLRLLPSKHHVDELKRDYHAMQAMIFGSVPSFEEIIAALIVLEDSINALKED